MIAENRAHDLIRAFVRMEHSMAGEDPGALLELLRHALPAHFRAEDRPGGVYDDIAARGVAPALLARLRADHRVFLDTLGELKVAADHGEDVRSALLALAQRIQVHERREAAAMIQLRPPADSPTSDPVGAVVREALAQAVEVPGRLITGIVVNVDGVPRWAVEDALTAAGLEFVEVHAVTDGPPGLQRVVFEPAESLVDGEDTRVSVEIGASGYRVTGEVRGHTLVFDEPTASGGTDGGPTPVEALLASLAACTAMTLRMYASRKGWALRSVRVTMTHRQMSRESCLECPADADFPLADRIGRAIEVAGDLDDTQVERLLDVANKCPVHRILVRQPVVVTELHRV